MRYTQILHTAKELTVKNPMFSLFGLVLYGGFNLYAINFFALTQYTGERLTSSDLLPQQYLVLLCAGVILFVVMNVVKILFIVIVHNELHNVKSLMCATCVAVGVKNIPYVTWLRNVLLASSITIILTSVVAFATGSVVSQYAIGNTPVIIINILFVALVTCIVAAWNLFTSYFVIMQAMSFAKASKAALDLLMTRLRIVAEFIIILLLLYGASAIIGNAFIHVWQEGIAGFEQFHVRAIGLLLFVIWFAFNNTFFNIALVVFFDTLVRSIGSEDKAMAPNGQLSPNILN